MLVYATITKFEGLGKDNRVTIATGTPCLLQGSHIQGMEVRASTKSKFLYQDDVNDYRERPAYVEAEEAVSAIIADMDKTFNTTSLPLLLHTDNSATGTTFTRYILGESIVFAWKYSATKSWVTYLEGSKRKTVLCAYSLKQIRELADTSDLTTT